MEAMCRYRTPARKSARSVLVELLDSDELATVAHGEDLHGRTEAVEDAVGTVDELAHGPSAELRDHSAALGKQGQALDRVEEADRPALGGVGVIQGDVDSYLPHPLKRRVGPDYLHSLMLSMMRALASA